MIDIKHVKGYRHEYLNSRIHWQIRGIFRFLIISRVGLGRVLAGCQTDTHIDYDADTSEKTVVFIYLIYKINTKHM